MQVGDAVEICLSRQRVLFAAAATYGLLLACIAGGVAMASLAAGSGSDALSACGCVGGFLAGAVLVRLIAPRHERAFLPIARRVAGQNATAK